MNDEIIQACRNYFMGQESTENILLIRDFLSKGDEYVREFREYEKEWKAEEIPTLSQVVSFSKIKRKINKKAVRRRHFFALGGIVAIAFVIAFFAFVTTGRFIFSLQKPDTYLVESGMKENTRVVLPDSTVVYLNSSSKFSYKSDFGKETRDVYLDGEAFFDVAKQDGHPFVVHTDRTSITVYGTKFDLCSYSVDDSVYAVLVEGSIDFKTPCATVKMVPGELVTFDKTDSSISKRCVNVDCWLSWMNGRINLSAFPLAKLFKRLSILYDSPINYSPVKYGNLTINALLNSSDSLENILEALEILTPIKWSQSEDGAIYVKER